MSQDTNKVNPANAPAKAAPERERVPMSLPLQKLAVPELPGYHLHWMLGTSQRIGQALRAGYEFVDPSEVDVINHGLADDASRSGNTDMGSRVSISAGADLGEDNQTQRLYLMKIKEEWWQEDQRKLEERNEQIAATIRGGGNVGANPHGTEQTYIPKGHQSAVRNIFIPKR